MACPLVSRCFKEHTKEINQASFREHSLYKSVWQLGEGFSPEEAQENTDTGIYGIFLSKQAKMCDIDEQWKNSLVRPKPDGLSLKDCETLNKQAGDIADKARSDATEAFLKDLEGFQSSTTKMVRKFLNEGDKVTFYSFDGADRFGLTVYPRKGVVITLESWTTDWVQHLPRPASLDYLSADKIRQPLCQAIDHEILVSLVLGCALEVVTNPVESL